MALTPGSSPTLRVLHVLAETGYSGGEIQLEHLVHDLQAHGHQNHLALAPGARFSEVGDKLGIPHATIDLRRPIRTGAMGKIRALVDEFDPHVLHFGCGRSLLWAGFATRRNHRPVKVTTRRIDYPIGRSLYRGGRYRHLVDHTAANCKSVEQRVLDAGVPRDRVSLIHEGIDVEPWRPVKQQRAEARRKLGIAEDMVVISCAATLRPRKGQRNQIDAFLRIAKDRPKTMLILAGGGTDLEALQAKAAETGLGDRLRVPGPIKPVADLYAATDIFTMPSFNEGLSNACLEAGAVGLPQVVSTVGGLPEIVLEGQGGFVIEPGDVPALADRWARLVDDAELRNRMGVSIQEHVCSTFTAARMTRGMEDLFLRLVAERQASDVEAPR